MSVPAPCYSVYRFNWLWRIFPLAFLAIGAAGSWDSWRNVLSGLREPKFFDLTVPALLLSAGLLMTTHFFVAKITFTIDAIEHRTIFGSKYLPLYEIRGRREYILRGSPDEGGNTRYLKLESNDDRVPDLEFSTSYAFDEAFFSWYYSLPDLDLKDKESGKGTNLGAI
jgi:hypothetical protein